MWCHMCQKEFPDFEVFRDHILENHPFHESDSSDEQTEPNKTIDKNNENALLITSPGRDDDDDNSSAINALPAECYYSDNSMDDLNLFSEKSDEDEDKASEDENKLSEDEDENKLSEDEDENKLSEDEDENKASEDEDKASEDGNKASEIKDNASEIKDNASENEDKAFEVEDKASVLDAKSQNGKQHIIEKSIVIRNLADKIRKRLARKSSTLKINGQKKKKISLSEVLPKRKRSVVSYEEEEMSELSDAESSVSEESNQQSAPVNCHNSISKNNPIVLIKPCEGQSMNNFVIANNKTVQQPFYIVRPVRETTNTRKSGFTSENILRFLAKHKELCKGVKYPLPQSFYNRIKEANKAIFDHYCTVSAREETSAVLKVYEVFDCMIHKHINSL